MGIYYNALVRWNCSAIFLLPLLGIPNVVLGEMGLINTFLDDVNHDAIDIEGEKLYLLFNNIDNVAFSDFLTEWRGKLNIIDDYDYSGGWIVVVVQLDSMWKKDYEKFYAGKYSQFSEEFKNKFPKTDKVVSNGKRMDDITLQWSIFKKDKRIIEEWRNEYELDIHKNDEVWQAPQMDKEVLTEEYLEKIIKEYNNDKSEEHI